MQIHNVNTCENLIQKLANVKVAFDQTKNELEVIKKKNEILSADNAAYQDSLFELKVKVHMFQKQEAEKTKQIEDELSELKKAHQKAMQELASLKSK